MKKLAKEIIVEFTKPWYVDYEHMSDKELLEYFQDIQADRVINEQKENTYYEP